MKIGLFTATFLDMKVEDVFKMASGLGYQAVEMPAFANNPHLDIEQVVKGSQAAELKKLVKSYGLIISALANHPEGQIVLGPYGKDTDAICPGTKEEKIKFGTERMIKTAQAANALEVPVVTGFVGCENFGRFFPWPYSKGWADMEQEFVERWSKILDKFGEYGVKFAHEPHPNELVYNVETALRAVELLGGRKEFGFNFDPANLTYLGIDVEYFIDAAGGAHLPRARQGRRDRDPQRQALRADPAGRLAAAGPRLPLPHPGLGLGAVEEGHHRAVDDRLRLRDELRARRRDHEPQRRHHQDHRLPETAVDREAVRGPARRAVQLTRS